MQVIHRCGDAQVGAVGWEPREEPSVLAWGEAQRVGHLACASRCGGPWKGGNRC